MKKWISKLTLALLLALTFTVSAFAWQDYGSTYTAMDALDTFSSNITFLMAVQSDPSRLPEKGPEALASQGVPDEEIEPQGVPNETESNMNAEPNRTDPATEAPSAPVQTLEPADNSLILDEAGMLTDTQKLRLEDQARKIAAKYDCNPYVLTVNSLDGEIPREFAKAYYQEHGLGNGDYRNGILFLVAMDSRDYVTVTYGRNPKNSEEYGMGILAFTDYGISKLEDDVVPQLSDGDYFAALQTYLTDCEMYLDDYSQGEAFDKGARLPGTPLFSPVQILIIIFVPLLIALIVCLIFKAQMKTARKAAGAGNYLVDGSFQLTDGRDDYVRTTRTSHKMERNHSGGSSRDSDGFGGSGGGKF